MSVASEPIRVLHVDDEPGFVDLASRFLERQDHRFDIEAATSADEGASRLSGGGFDCVVSDYDMPGRSGIEFLRRVRDEHPDLPFILYTGQGSEEVASDAISAGATDYLQKDSGTGHFELLGNRIANAVSRAQSQRAERRLRELAENTDRILFSVRADDGEILFINSAYEEIWGRSVDALRADPTDLFAGVHPDDRDRIREAIERTAAGETIELEIRVNADEDYERWARVRGEPIPDRNDVVVRVAGFATDITDRKELQQTLRTRTERLEEAQRVAGVGSWEWDAATDTVVWSDETYRLFGWDPDASETPTFEDWLSAVHPDDRERAQSVVEEAMATGSFRTFEHRIERADGDELWVQCRGDVTQEDGEAVRVTGTILNITDRTEYERDLEYQQSVLESVVETLPEAVFVVDDDREVFTYNRRFVELWDVPDAVVESGDYRDVVDVVLEKLDRPDEFRATVEHYEEHPDETGEAWLDLEDGRVVRAFTAPATDDDGGYYGRIWAFQDVA